MDEKVIMIPGWKIVRTIGKGGFGSVYEVEKEDGVGGVIRSALKVISIPEPGADITSYRDDGYDDVSLTALFKSQVEDITAEFRLMNKLKGYSNIVSFEDYTIVQHDNEPGYDIYIRMELLTPLPRAFEQELLQTGVTDETVRKLGVDICNALELCRKNNIIHRDIKPQNIFVNDNGDFKLGDFGIAKTSDHTTRATKTGTVGYMAPEVYLSRPYNAAVDQYSLGLVLYWMLNERRGPFLPLPPEVPTPTQSTEALERRMHGEPLPAPKHGSEELKRIVLKACAFDPKDRYANPTEMKHDLERLSFETEEAVTHAETEQVNRTFGADEGGKTIGVFGERQTTPEKPPVQEDEKTFGVFGGKPATQQEAPVAEDEKTFGAFRVRQPKESEPIPADGVTTVSVKKPTSEKQAEKPVEPEKEIKPVNAVPEQKRNKKRRTFISVAAILAALITALIIILALRCNTCRTDAPVAEVSTTTAAEETDTPVPSQKAQPTATATSPAEPSIESTPTSTAEPTIVTAEETKLPVVMKTIDWTTEKPPENAENVLKKTQYSYRDKKTKTSTESSVSGWTFERSEDVWGDWSSWSTTPAAQSATVDVESKKQYRLYFFLCSKCGYHMPLWGTERKCWKCGKLGLKTEKGKKIKWIDTPYNQLKYKNTIKPSNKKQVVYEGELWYFNTSDLNASESKYIRTVYRSRTLEKKYYYWKWSDWSSWSDKRNSGHDDTRTRTLWKYQIPET